VSVAGLGLQEPDRPGLKACSLTAFERRSDGVNRPVEEGRLEQAGTIGLDAAKWGFQVHGAETSGHMTGRKQLVKAKLLASFSVQPPCTVALEVGGGARSASMPCAGTWRGMARRALKGIPQAGALIRHVSRRQRPGSPPWHRQVHVVH
jgi:hypothetical protein